MKLAKFISITLLLTGSLINSTELQKKPKYVQKKNYKIDIEILKQFLPDVLVVKIFSYHVRTVNYLMRFKNIYTSDSRIEKFVANTDKKYLAVKFKNQIFAIISLDDLDLMNMNDARYKDAEKQIKLKRETGSRFLYESFENQKFDLRVRPGGGFLIMHIRITEKYALELIQKMNLKQLELIINLEQAFRAYIYKILSKKTVIEKPLELPLNYYQTKTFFSLPGFFVKIYLSEDCRKFEFEV